MTRGHHERHGHPLLDRTDEIQFLAPRTDLFASGSDLHDVTPADGGERAFADVDEDTPRPRWLTIGAGIGLVALIAVGVVAASPWRNGPTTAAPVTVPPGQRPTASTIPVVSTPRPVLTPATLSPENAAVVRDAFLIDPARVPAGMTVLPANMPADRRNSAAPPTENGPAGWMELWATPGATRTSGSWYAIGWSPMRDMMTATDAARILVGDEIALLATAADGVETLMFERDNGTATLSWFGRSSDEMLALAGQFRFTSIGRPVYPHVSTPGSLVRVVTQESNGRDLAADYGSLGSTSNAGYQVATGQYIGITTFPTDPTHDALRPFVVVGALGAPSGPVASRTVVDGRSVVVGRLAIDQWAGADPNNVVEWNDGDQTVMLGGNVDVETLVALVPLIRRGTSGEWWEMSTTKWPDGSPEQVAGRTATPAMLGFGDLADGDQWYLDIDAAGRIADFSATGTSDGNGIYLGIDLAAGPCAVESNLDSTVVVCIRPASEGVEVLHIEGAWGSHDISLSTRDPSGSYTFAVAQFSDPGSFRVDIVGADGRTLPALSVGPMDGA